MSAPKGVVNVKRRTWDKKEFEEKARERFERESAGIVEESTQKKVIYSNTQKSSASSGTQKSFLQAREESVKLDTNLNKKVIVTSTTPQGAHGGFFCETCNCTLKDSASYLSHINGKNHLSALGMGTQVMRSTVDEVKSKLSTFTSNTKPSLTSLLAAKLGKSSPSPSPVAESTSTDVSKKRPREEEKTPEESLQNEDVSKGDEEAKESAPEDEKVDPMVAMLGFGGFGGSKKN